MNADLHRELVICKPWTILGLDLLPFSIGHKLLLQQIGSPYETGTMPDQADLALAVEICSGTFERGLARLNDEGAHKQRRAWIKALRGTDWEAKGVMFRDYIAYHSRWYSFAANHNESKSAPSQTPLLHAVIVSLMKFMHLTESQAVNRCFGLAMCDYIVCAEKDGGITVSDKEVSAAVQSVLADYVAKHQEAKA